MNTANSWSPPSEANRLGKDKVHVWRVNLDRTSAYIQGISGYLSEDEKSKAERFLMDKDRKQYIVARGFLRVILSRYSKRDPGQLRFSYNSYGKPSLLGFNKDDEIEFNVSHSCGVALYGITRNRKVGIDLERILPRIKFEQIANQFFSPREKAMLMEIPEAKARRKAFYRCWTRKEAYIKARGEGLSVPLHQFDVSLAPDDPARLLRHNDLPKEEDRWSLKDIQPARGFVACLAVEGQDWNLTCFDAFHYHPV